MTLYELAIAPFNDYGFMRRALIGVLLMLRRMSLIDDAMSHAVLPGAAIGFMIAGTLSLPIMGFGCWTHCGDIVWHRQSQHQSKRRQPLGIRKLVREVIPIKAINSP